MESYKKMLRQVFPGAEIPKNFIPLFPNRFLIPKEAWELTGGEKEFERLRRTYPDFITTYPRGEKGSATKFSLYEIQDAIHQEAKDFRQQFKVRP